MNCRTFLVSSFRAVPSLLTMDFRDGPSVQAQFGAGAVSDIIAAGPGSRIGFRSQSDNGAYDYVTRCTLNNASASGAGASAVRMAAWRPMSRPLSEGTLFRGSSSAQLQALIAVGRRPQAQISAST